LTLNIENVINTDNNTTESTNGTTLTAQLDFTSAGNRLVGSLLSPGTGPAPAALLLSGSGTLDRDSNTKRLRIDVMRQVADYLASIGIASFRYDKRGVGASSGTYHATGFWDNVADARSALAALKARPEVDADRVVVIGHSEGALIAGELATDGGAAGVVLLAGAAQAGEQVLRWQATQVAASLPKPAALVLKLLRKDIASMQNKRLAQLRQSEGDVIRIQLVRVNARWFREFLEYDPQPTLRRVQVPVLAITGSKDIQVDPGDVARMESIVPGEFTGRVVPDLTHLLRTTAEPPSLKMYKKQVKRPVDAEVLATVERWIREITRDTKGVSHDAV
jgi:pimeloyl-ACP methyl ester carboxylesterase